MSDILVAEATTAPWRQKLIVLCDGTWCGAETATETNIYRLAEMFGINMREREHELRPSGNDFRNVRYFEGSGIGGTFLEYLFNGATGNDIGEDCIEVYKYIVQHFTERHDIWMFGLSRGAYTVRCVAGMINNCGILKRRDEDGRRLDEANTGGALNTREITLCREVYKIYRSPDPEDHPKHQRSLDFRNMASYTLAPEPGSTLLSRPPIKFMGLFDTVGSRGIPKLDAGIGLHYPEFYDQIVSSVVHAATTIPANVGRFTSDTVAGVARIANDTFEAGGHITIDVAENIGHAAIDVAENIGHAVIGTAEFFGQIIFAPFVGHDAINAVANAGQEALATTAGVGHAATTISANVGRFTSDTIAGVARITNDTFKAGGHITVDVAENIGHAAINVTENIGHAAIGTAEFFGHAFSGVTDEVIRCILDLLSMTVEPNHVFADYVLHWMLQSINHSSDNLVTTMPNITDKLAELNRSIMHENADTGSGDIYDDTLSTAPVGRVLELLAHLIPDLRILTNALVQTRDRRISNNGAEVANYRQGHEGGRSIEYLGRLGRTDGGYRSQTHNDFEEYMDAMRL
ncbi:hypothetical protein BGZ81_002605 [Podila clonocystis]|nr:hypothetical protein BGZ81_002605 [Podila clonocystis]